MDRFATLEPVKLYNSSSTFKASSRNSRLPSAKAPAPFQIIGRLPVDIHILILTYLSVPDLSAYSRASKAFANLAKDERVWEVRWNHFTSHSPNLPTVLDDLENRSKAQNGLLKENAPPTLAVDAEDDFGEFTSVNAPKDEMGDFVGAFPPHAVHSPLPDASFPPKPNYRSQYVRAHTLLKPLLSALSGAPHAVLSTLFPSPSPSLSHQAHTLRVLSSFLSFRVKPVREWQNLSSALRAAKDRFDDGLMTAFDTSDSKNDEANMKETSQASWDIWDGPPDRWELARAWADKREIFYDQSKWDPLENFTEDGQLDFDAMDAFMGHVLRALEEHGTRAVNVFPPEAGVLLAFAERLAHEVIAEYIASLLDRAREISNEMFLKAAAGSFKEAWRLVDATFKVASTRSDAAITQTQAEDVVYRMFESNMDEYLDEEVEFINQSFDAICRTWEKQLSERATIPAPTADHARFLSSHNPAQVKRTVLASFTDVLLLPVTIVPRTVGHVGKAVNAAFTTGSSAAVQGISMLNPQRWGAPSARDGYIQDFEKGNAGMLFEIGGDEDDEEDIQEKGGTSSRPTSMSMHSTSNSISSTLGDSSSQRSTRQSSTTSTGVTTPAPSASASTASFDKMELLLSLDIALELIHADREALKRVETFIGYPGHYGHRVRDTIEEIFVLLLQALGERHIRPGFERATDQMRAYHPEEHEESQSVAPLLQFFELAHVGDTMQSMIQVYFDKELASHIDRTDFLNTVVREKKRFEDILDDCVAAGMNAGTDALMNQVEHVILRLTKPREYYPAEDAAMDLGPTQGCQEAIKCLGMHCQLLKGSTSKEVLEVFYQEIGIRLIAILQKHIKRQIISLNGGFQIIADLNAYYTFIASLKVPTIAAEFSYLKMLGHVYVVEDAKDLAQIVRDVTRYGGAYRPEVSLHEHVLNGLLMIAQDVYEFIQRRSDWKKIEKTVDKTMYNLSFKEDCIIS
ncbi:unnamed protein product [Somion occarium]|uniref:F-box domain-containing protein n=1 Tax=Somion occarium TaxID=3059160 RepID=A0ABP1DS18_9APHY